jgi:hypothetical protein
MLRICGEHFAGGFKGEFTALESPILKLHSSVYLQPDPVLITPTFVLMTMHTLLIQLLAYS